MRGSIELSGTAETIVGQHPPAVTATALPTLGRDVSAPGAFDVILPVRIGYDVLKDKITQAIAAMPPVAGSPSGTSTSIRRRASSSSACASPKRPIPIRMPGQWVYLTGALQVDADGHAVRLSDLGVMTDDEGLAPLIDPIAGQLRDKMSVDYGIAYDNLLNAANAKLNRPLKDGYRMEGHLSSAELEKRVLCPPMAS